MILVDAHVHIYGCFNLPTFFDSAFENFESEAARLKHGPNAFAGILLLTETSMDNWFERLRINANNKHEDVNKFLGHWKIHPTDENSSLRVVRNEEETIFLIAGRQIATREGLEVLALLTEKSFKDGGLFMETIQAVEDSGGIPAVPWGFGKWMGRRGRILNELLNTIEDLGLFLGDNSNRPGFLPDPPQFKQAEKRQIQVLPGSDPFPFPSESERVGNFGFSVDGAISVEHPAKDLKAILFESQGPLHPYGSLERPYRFLRNQLAIQIKKRFRKSSRK